MKRILLFLCFLTTVTMSWSQHFLADKVGTYKGYLKMCNGKGACDSLYFENTITVTNSPNRYNTLTRYFLPNGMIDEKNYDLVIDTNFTDLHHYILDEKDGILIYETLEGKTMHSTYTVAGNLFTVRTTYSTDKIDYELVVYSMEKLFSTVSEPDDAGTSYTIETFPFVTIQRGVLTKTTTTK